MKFTCFYIQNHTSNFVLSSFTNSVFVELVFQQGKSVAVVDLLVTLEAPRSCAVFAGLALVVRIGFFVAVAALPLGLHVLALRWVAVVLLHFVLDLVVAHVGFVTKFRDFDADFVFELFEFVFAFCQLFFQEMVLSVQAFDLFFLGQIQVFEILDNSLFVSRLRSHLGENVVLERLNLVVALVILLIIEGHPWHLELANWTRNHKVCTGQLQMMMEFLERRKLDSAVFAVSG